MIYIAAPFFNPEQLANVQRVEEILTRASLAYFSPRLHGINVGTLPLEERKQGTKMAKVFKGNIDAMRGSAFMLACVDGKDQGTNWEMGWFYHHYALEPDLRCYNIVTWSGNGSPSNLMIQQGTGGHCATLDDVQAFIDYLGTKGAPSTPLNLSPPFWRNLVKEYQGFNFLDVEEK